MKKMYNGLSERLPAEKLHLLDVPQTKNKEAAKFLAREFEKIAEKFCVKASPSPQSLSGREPVSKAGTMNIGILGANVPMEDVEAGLENFGFKALYLNHCLTKSHPEDELMSVLQSSGLQEYAAAFLEQGSCPRFNDDTYKARLGQIVEDQGVVGLIVNAIKFCDFHPFDFRYFKNKFGNNFPILLIEHELTSSSKGQTMTRIEAFLESIKKRFPNEQESDAGKRACEGEYFVGIDSGSHATKLVCIDKNKNIITRQVVPTGTSVTKSAETLLKKLVDQFNIKRSDIAKVVGTGYGRSKIGGVDSVVTEISCHALGASHILGKPVTIIDIGGQDSKAIKIDANGGVVRFAMNDKCAAGTGRFLEVIADRLEMGLEEFAELSWQAKKSVAISSMCSVFAESEVISLIASGNTKEEIAKGIHKAIAERTIALARRIDGEPPYYMTGGVAKNRGLVKELENCLGTKMEVLEEPQFSGALGAAILALRG
jgi:predicted CoA-substrate-specific enzyme activase